MNYAVAVKNAVIVEEFTPLCRNTLRGFAKIVLPSGMILSDVAIHVSHGAAWASPASKPMVSRDGMVVKDASGKVRYVPIVSFASKELRDRFSGAVIEALRASYPEALE